MLTELPPLSLYVHVPWCVRKCPYCDFNSHASPGELPEKAYLEALMANFDSYQNWVAGRELQSIFIGGGTPSLLSSATIASLLQQLQQRIAFASDGEITLEANPGTFEQARFEQYRRAGINRLSIGVQSFSDTHLHRLGRIHCADEAIKAFATARSAGFDNINLDLMHGLPDQSPEQALADLHQAIELGPEHISWYQLTIEKNTEFFSRPPALPEEETLWAIQEQGQQLLAQAGYQQYEVSAYSRQGRHSRHNLNYWRFGDYIGIGAGAHGKLTSLEQSGVVRTQETRLPKDYMARIAQTGDHFHTVPKDELAFEFMMNVLRLKDGVELALFEQRTGLSFSVIDSTWNELVAQGLVQAGRLSTTDRGFLFLNRVLDQFLE